MSKKNPNKAEQPPQAQKPDKKPSRPLNRWRIGMLSSIQLVLLVVTLLAFNYLSLHHFQRIDLSRDKDYTLSPSTSRYLASSAITERETPIRWIMAYRRTSPFYERVRALAEEYARLSGGRIELTLVDPARNSDRMEEINAAYGISLIRDLIIIDARSDDSPVTTEGKDRIKVLNPNIKIVIADQMVAYNIVNEERRITGFQGEDMLTASLVESIEGQPRRMALLTDKSRIGRRETSPSRKTLEELMRFQNIALGELQIAGLETIPEDINGLLVVSPKYDFSEEEIKVLQDYWNRPQSSLLVMLGDEPVPARFRAFLRKQGITPQNDRVIAAGPNGLVTAARAMFTEGIRFTSDLARQTTEFGGASCSLKVREGAEDLLIQRINPMAVLEVVGGFWGESEFGYGNESYDEESDNGPPLHLAAAVTRGAETDDRFAAESSRMVVIGNTEFLDPEQHRAENLDFLASSVNWLVGRDELTGITPRSLSTYKLPLLQAQISFINRCNLVFLPAALLLLGTFIWSSRRA